MGGTTSWLPRRGGAASGAWAKARLWAHLPRYLVVACLAFQEQASRSKGWGFTLTHEVIMGLSAIRGAFPPPLLLCSTSCPFTSARGASRTRLQHPKALGDPERGNRRAGPCCSCHMDLARSNLTRPLAEPVSIPWMGPTARPGLFSVELPGRPWCLWQGRGD